MLEMRFINKLGKERNGGFISIYAVNQWQVLINT